MQLPLFNDDKVRVLFVCLGNICRSPAAEGIFKKMVADNELEDKIYMDSAGTSGWHEANCPMTGCACTDNGADTIFAHAHENSNTEILNCSTTLL